MLEHLQHGRLQRRGLVVPLGLLLQVVQDEDAVGADGDEEETGDDVHEGEEGDAVDDRVEEVRHGDRAADVRHRREHQHDGAQVEEEQDEDAAHGDAEKHDVFEDVLREGLGSDVQGHGARLHQSLADGAAVQFVHVVVPQLFGVGEPVSHPLVVQHVPGIADVQHRVGDCRLGRIAVFHEVDIGQIVEDLVDGPVLVALLWHAGAGRVSGSTRSREEAVEVVPRTVLDNFQRRCHVGVADGAAVADVLAVESPDVQV